MIIFYGGFNWAGVIGNIDGIWSRSGAVSLSLTGSRAGRCAVVIAAGSGSYIQRDLGASYTTICLGIPINDNGSTAEFGVFQLTNSSGSDILHLRRTSGGVLVAARGNSAGAQVAIGTTSIGTGFHYIEARIVIHASLGSVHTWVDGAPDIATAADQNTEGAAGGARNVRLGDREGSALASPLYEHLVVTDDAPLGDLSIDAIPVGSDLAQMDWVQSTGATVFGVLDDIPNNGDTDYASADADGARSEFGVVPPGYGSTVSVKAVQTVAVARQENAGAHGVILGLGINGTPGTDSPKRVLSTAYRSAVGVVHETNPDTLSPWANADIDDIELALEYEP